MRRPIWRFRFSGDIVDGMSSDAPIPAPAPVDPPSGPPKEEAPSKGAAPVGEAVEQAHLWLRRLDQWLVGVLLTVAVVLLGLHWLRLSGWGSESVELRQLQSREYHYMLDANQAGWVEWMQLEGIGEVLARRIVAEREEHGPFRSVDDLRRVKGIGEKTLEKLRPFVIVRDLP